jgi:CRISPR-associated exonuclease Cas4
MLGIEIGEGMIFHAKSQQRTLVPMDSDLRRETLCAISALRVLFDARIVPPPALKPQCDGCSLRDICIPETSKPRIFKIFSTP